MEPARSTHRWRAVRWDLRYAWRATLINTRAAGAYRANLVTSLLFGVLWQASTIAFASILVRDFSGMGEWPSGAVLMMVAMRLMSHALYAMIFDNVTRVRELIDDGRFNAYLLRPVSPLVQVVFHRVNVNAIGDLAVALTMFTVAVRIAVIHWSVGMIAFICAAIISGCLIETAIQLAVSSCLLRTSAIGALGTWIEDIMGTFGNYPINIFPFAVKVLLVGVVPMAFISYLPAMVVTGGGSESLLLHQFAKFAPLAGPIMFAAACAFWHRSLRGYSSVGG